MPSDLIFANRSLLVLTGSRLECFFSRWAHREQAMVIVSCFNPWAHREQGLLLSSSVITLLSGSYDVFVADYIL